MVPRAHCDPSRPAGLTHRRKQSKVGELQNDALVDSLRQGRACQKGEIETGHRPQRDRSSPRQPPTEERKKKDERRAPEPLTALLAHSPSFNLIPTKFISPSVFKKKTRGWPDRRIQGTGGAGVNRSRGGHFTMSESRSIHRSAQAPDFFWALVPKRTLLTAVSNTSLSPSCVMAEHSMY